MRIQTSHRSRDTAAPRRPQALRRQAATPDLPAIEGGAPVRSSFLPFARPSLGPEEETAVIEVLRSGWLGTGARTDRFEEEFASLIGTAHAIAVGSCTAGLHLALRALGVGPGDEVIAPAMTFPATINAVIHAGGTPVLADVLPGRLTIDPAAVAAAITPRTRAIIAVHFAGWPCEMGALRQIARDRGLALVEDAAHALGATYSGCAAGALGDVAVFSFYPTKNITTGEGGMITTDRVDLVPQLRRERLHGIDRDASRRADGSYEHWEAVSLGWKYNLTDIAAAIGLAQLPKLARFLDERRAQDACYRERLAGLAVEPLSGPPEARTAAHLFPVLLAPRALAVGRDRVLRALLAENVGVGVHFRALPLHRHVRRTLGVAPEDFPVALDASDRLLSLPLYPGMTGSDQDDVITALERVLRWYAAG
ncbi:MAG TPA: DegT/DnrJ/EryC1/StrS family aminotransferase [Candidatus Binatia bacterium]|nr:DegT/DnrJ/EryC1/StrS family aminotransferase [Candidatus Binatia bacterium]